MAETADAPADVAQPPAGPLLVACLRVTDPRPDVDPLSGAVTRDHRLAGLAANDAAALEYALQLAEAWSGSVLAVAAGPEAIEATLRQVEACGAQVLRVPRPGASHQPGTHGGPAEPLGSAQDYLEDLTGAERLIARGLAHAIRTVGAPALVLCGDRSVDRGSGAVPAFLAAELGLDQALGLVSLRQDAKAPRELIGERRLDGGRREVLRITGPAVCSVEAAGVRLRRAPLAAALATTRASVPVTAPASGQVSVRHDGGRPYRPRPRVVPPPAGDAPRDRLLALTGALVSHEPPTLLGPLGAAEAADALLEFLTRHGYVS